MSLTLRSALLVLGISLLASGTWAQPAAEKEIRARRDAFTKAMNARKGKEVVAFLDPSFTDKRKDGSTMDYKQAAALFEQVFNSRPPGAAITTKIEKVEVKGDTVTLTVTESISFTDAQGNKQSNSGRSKEVWKKVKDRWMLVGNEEL